jgi:hypothetical protein
MNYQAVPVIALYRTNQKAVLDGNLASGVDDDFGTDNGIFKPANIPWPGIYSRQSRPFFNFLPGLVRGPPGK